MLPFLYQRILKPGLFRFDPERVHDSFVSLGGALGRSPTRKLVSGMYGYRGPDASATVDGLHYRTPVVLAAGFDYNGRLLQILPAVGFGGVEVGSVTALPTPGNEPPRMRRLVRSRSIVVNKGLMNEGVEIVSSRLGSTETPHDFVVGVSLARSNRKEVVGEEAGIEDYAASLEHLVRRGIGDFFTVNISCPNVHGGESFADPERLDPPWGAWAEWNTTVPSTPRCPSIPAGTSFDESPT